MTNLVNPKMVTFAAAFLPNSSTAVGAVMVALAARLAFER